MKLKNSAKENLLAILSILLILMFLIALDAYNIWSRNTEYLKADANNTAQFTNEMLEDVVVTLGTISKAPIITESKPQEVSVFLKQVNETYPQVSAFAIANLEGIRWAGSALGVKPFKVTGNFFKMVKNTGKPYIGGVNKSVFNNKVEFIVGYPIFNKSHQLTNVLFAPVYASTFKDFFKNINLQSNGNLHIIDRHNRMLIADNTDVDHLVTYNSASDSLRVKAIAPIGDTGWKIIIDKDASVVVGEIAKKIIVDLLLFIIILLPVIMGFYRLISELNKQKEQLITSNEKLQNLASTDGLTGLLNHREFQDKLATLLKAASKNKPLSLLMMDIDNFKIFNDKHGHQTGDRVLQHLSALLTEFIGQRGVIARYGGEEFVVILPNADKESSSKLANQLSEEVSLADFEIEDGQKANITVSIGLSTFPNDAGDRENLIRHADQALYKAKEQVSNKVQMYYSVMEELGPTLGDNDLLKVISTLNTIINAKDKYTYAHSERVMNYSVQLAKKIGLPIKDVSNIKIGALLHDIGKIEISGEILNKPSKLTKEEFEHIKKHPIIGSDIVRPIKTLEKAIDFVTYHHERYDGKGYPYSLIAEKIPLYGRIAAIADSFDAMTSNRPYQTAKTLTDAIEELRRGSGTQFDPQLVEAFIDLLLTECIVVNQ